MTRLNVDDPDPLVGLGSSERPVPIDVQPCKGHYDEYGRLVGRADFSAGNKAAGIPDVHRHTFEWGPAKTTLASGSHIPGTYKQ